MKKLIAIGVGISCWLAIACSAQAAADLQQQIDATPENGVLTLADQTYEGNVVINKPMTLIGSGHTVIRGDGQGNVITVNASHVRLEKLKIEHGSMSRNSAEEYSGVKVTSSHNVLQDLDVSDSFHGIFLWYAHHNEVRNSKIEGQGGGIIGGQGNGIQLIHSFDNKLINNHVQGARDGIYFYYSDRNQSIGNQISDTRYGLHYMYAHENQFLNNKFSRNIGGAAIMVSHDIELRGNEFSFHQGTQSFGLLMQDSQNVTIEENQFYENQRALMIDNASQNRIARNNFFHNQIAVELWGSASQQVFTENHFQQNTAPVITIGGLGSNHFSDQGRGNHWGETMPLLDLNRDGIGDDKIEYKSALNKLIQKNELVYLFLDSPAIPIYEKLGQLMNQQDVMITDPYPLMEEPKLHPAAWLLFVAGLFLCGGGYWWRRRKQR